MTATAEDRAAAYAQAAVSRAAADVAGAAPGERNRALNRAAFGLGRVLHALPLATEEAEAALVAAATAAGLGLIEATYHTRRGLAEGRAKPADLPDFRDRDRRPGRRRRGPVPPAPTAPAAAAEPAKPRPPVGQVHKLFYSAVPIPRHREACAYLESRGIDPLAAGVTGLCMALPPGTPCPPWAYAAGRPWSDTHPLLFPLHDGQGRFVSLMARRIGPGPGPKSVRPTGCDARGLFLANRPGVRLLKGESSSTWSPEDAEATNEATLWVCEGELDAVTRAAHVWGRDGCRPRAAEEHASQPAVLGVMAGSIQPGWCPPLPRDLSVCVATDADGAGEDYAAAFLAAVADRPDLRVSRWRGPKRPLDPTKRMDLNEWFAQKMRASTARRKAETVDVATEAAGPDRPGDTEIVP